MTGRLFVQGGRFCRIMPSLPVVRQQRAIMLQEDFENSAADYVSPAAGRVGARNRARLATVLDHDMQPSPALTNRNATGTH
jgi:hypothetical protein